MRELVDIGPLLDRCRDGDELAWEALVRQLQGPVYAVACHYLRDREEARDVAQDALIQVYRNLDKFEGLQGFKAWVIRVTRNCAIDRLRRLRARPPREDVLVEDARLGAGTADDPHLRAEASERRELLERALEGMSEINSEMILLKEIQGLKLEEIASMLGLPVGTVKSRSNRARLELATRVRALAPGYGA